MGEIVQFPTMPTPEEAPLGMGRLASINYVSDMTPDIIATFAELGVSDEFLPIVGRHISELELWTAPNLSSSRLEVVCSKPAGDSRKVWSRRAVISKPQLDLYEVAVNKALTASNRYDKLSPVLIAPVVDLEGVEIDTGEIASAFPREIALDWIIFELSADALANSYYMQQKFNKYIGDFNGQYIGIQAEMSMAEHFYDEYGAMSPDTKAIQEEYLRLRAGIALYLLTDDLVRKSDYSLGQARWIVRLLRQKYPSPLMRPQKIVPLKRLETMTRLSSLTPRKGVTEAYKELQNLEL